MTPEKLAAMAFAGLLGAGLGWAGQALTLSGRVAALEVQGARIESMLQTALRPQLGPVSRDSSSAGGAAR